MSERKVLNKYYPPDFDPSKIPRMKLAKNRQYTVRLMAPFNMRCKTCGEYIYKGKKFNARKEDVENETYLGIRIYRFYIKCTRCLQEISFKTDPKNTDYEIEAGATRNFMALKLAEEQAKRQLEEEREEEANNPMKLLENRTQQSRNEIEMLESLEELRDLNRRQCSVDYESMLHQYNNVETERERQEREEREDEEYIKSLNFKTKRNSAKIIAEEIIEIVSKDESPPEPKMPRPMTKSIPFVRNKPTFTMSSSNLVKRKQLATIVKPKIQTVAASSTTSSSDQGLVAEAFYPDDKEVASNEISSTVSETETVAEIVPEHRETNASVMVTEIGKSAGLSLLSAYTDSSDDSE